MKLPKIIQILNYNFKIVRSKTEYGSFQFARQKGEVGAITIKADIPESDLLEIFTHECLEIIYELLRVRYIKPDNAEFEFHYNHQVHDVASKIFSKIIYDLINNNQITK